MTSGEVFTGARLAIDHSAAKKGRALISPTRKAPRRVQVGLQLSGWLVPRLNVSGQDAVQRFGVTTAFSTMYTVNRRAISSGVIFAMWRLINRRLRASLSSTVI